MRLPPDASNASASRTTGSASSRRNWSRTYADRCIPGPHWESAACIRRRPRVHYGICLANIGTYSDPRVGVRVAAGAEAAGWDGVFIWDHLAFVWGAPAADPWITLPAIASATARVRIGTAVTPVARRRPQVLAQQVATLDVLSAGRVVFGAGLGGSPAESG